MLQRMKRSMLAASLLMSVVSTTLTGCADQPAPEQTKRDIDFMNKALHDRPAYEAVANQFIAYAQAGNADAMATLLSAGEKRHTGLAEINAFSRQQIIPFFQSHPTCSVITVAGATDGFGNSGYSYYGFATNASGERAPYAIYVVNEDGKLVIGSAMVNHYVKGRHGN